MTDDKPYIDPNSGAAEQPGGYVTPAAEPEQLQSDAERFATPEVEEKADPEPERTENTGETKTGTGEVITPARDGSGELSARTGETTSGDGQQVVSEDDAKGQVADPVSGQGTVPDDQQEKVNAEANGENTEVNEDTVPMTPAEPQPVVEAEAYDPSDKGVAEVLAYIKEHPEEKAAIIEAEKSGKNRSTIIGA